MAYNFLAEKRGEQNLRDLHESLSQFELVEFFPVSFSDSLLTLGISIPFKIVNDPRFKDEIEKVMTYFLVDQGFDVTDLFTGNALSSGDIASLVDRVSA